MRTDGGFQLLAFRKAGSLAAPRHPNLPSSEGRGDRVSGERVSPKAVAGIDRKQWERLQREPRTALLRCCLLY